MNFDSLRRYKNCHFIGSVIGSLIFAILFTSSNLFAQVDDGSSSSDEMQVQASTDALGNSGHIDESLAGTPSENNTDGTDATHEAELELPTTADTAVKNFSKKEIRSAPVAPDDPFLGNLETTLFDVYVGDKFKGAVLADYTNSWLEISDPDVVVEQLSDLREAARLLPLLTGKITGTRSIEGVGSITYKLNTFRIVISLNEKFLVATNLILERIAPDPNLGLTVQQRVGVTAAGTVDSNLNTAFNHRTIASRGQYFAVLDGAVVSNQPYEITEAKAGGIFGDYRASSGLLQTTGNNFAPSLQFAGIGVETAQELFLDQDLIRGSRFEVFVPSRSRVEFYRDGRIIAVQSLDFGLREIDTTQFPQGSYDVDIVITDSFGVVTRERKFFTKSGLLASANHPVFFLQLGSIRDNLDLSDVAVYQTGVRWRAGDVFDLGGSIYGSENLTIGSIETNALYRDIRFSAGYVGSSQNDAGVSTSLGASLLGIGFNFSLSQTLRGGNRNDPIPEPDPNDPFAPIFELNQRQRALVFQDRATRYFSIYKSVGPVDLRFAGEKNSGDGSPERRRFGPSVEWKVWSLPTSTFRFQASRFQTDADPITSLGLLYSYRLSKEWALSAQVVEREQSLGRESLFLVALNYDTKRFGAIGTRGSYRNEILDRNPKAGSSVLSVANQLDIDRVGDDVQTVGFVRDTRTDGADNTAIGGSIISSFLIDSDNRVSFGRPVSQESVFIAELPGEGASSPEGEFEVLLNNQVRGTVKPGGKSVIGVTPYKTYKIRIRPLQGADLVNYDSKITTATFFPGNVIRRVFAVEKIFIAIGRVVDKAGQPISNQRIKGPKEYTVTDEDGSFQAEITGKEVLKIDNKFNSCTLDLGIKDAPEYIAQVGDVVCAD